MPELTIAKRQALAKARLAAVSLKYPCSFCQQSIVAANIKRHEKSCRKNPKWLKEVGQCPVCDKPKNYKEALTCSRACANTLTMARENNPNWKEDTYRSTCFAYHERKCVVCDEKNIVEVHHLDGNDLNNKPQNLIPLCPTHHKYWHSRFRNLIEAKVMTYLENWKRNRSF